MTDEDWQDRCPFCDAQIAEFDREWGAGEPMVQFRLPGDDPKRLGVVTRITITCDNGHKFDTEGMQWSVGRGYRWRGLVKR